MTQYNKDGIIKSILVDDLTGDQRMLKSEYYSGGFLSEGWWHRGDAWANGWGPYENSNNGYEVGKTVAYFNPLVTLGNVISGIDSGEDMFEEKMGTWDYILAPFDFIPAEAIVKLGIVKASGLIIIAMKQAGKAGELILFSDKLNADLWLKHLAKRGWSIDDILTARHSRITTMGNINKYTGNSTTRYFLPNSKNYIVIDNGTNKIIQVSKKSKGIWKM